jgi:hypothetical protein
MPTMILPTQAAAAACKYPSTDRRAEADAYVNGLSNLDNDCTLLILSFLCHPDLNSFAICNRLNREVRGSPLLDQTRTGVIICSETTTVLQLYNKALDAGRWNNGLYSGKRTHLRVVGFKRWRDWNDELNRNVQLTGVTNLDLSCSPQHIRVVNQYFYYSLSFALAFMLPNLQELDLSYLDRTDSVIQNSVTYVPI